MSEPHIPLLDLCVLYADFNRPLLLEAFRRSFLDSASPAELKAIRTAIRAGAIAPRKSHKKGRPRAEKNWTWICSSLRLVWLREIDGWSWPSLARAVGLNPTKPNLRTLQRRRDHYAALLWQTLPGSADNPGSLDRLLDSKRVQGLLRSRLALPFDTHPQQSKRLVLKLAPRGLAVASNQL